MFKEAEHENIPNKVRKTEEGLGIPAMLYSHLQTNCSESKNLRKRETKSCQAACLRDGYKLGIMG